MKTCFWRSHQKEILAIFVGEYLLAKIAQKLFGKVWGNSGKNPSPQKYLRASTRAAEPEARSRPFSVEPELLLKFS